MDIDASQEGESHQFVPSIISPSTRILDPHLPYGYHRHLTQKKRRPRSNSRNINNIDVLAASAAVTNKNKHDKKRTLVIRNLPMNLNSIGLLEQHFCKFGTVVSIKVCYENDPKSALIQFSSSLEATAAYRNTEPLFNNRFIKVFWMKGGEKNWHQPRRHSLHVKTIDQNVDHNQKINLDSVTTPLVEKRPLQPRRYSGVTVFPKILQMVDNERKLLCETVHNQNLLIAKLLAAKTAKEKGAIKKLLKESIKRHGDIKPTARLIDTIYGFSQENSATNSRPQKMEQCSLSETDTQRCLAFPSKLPKLPILLDSEAHTPSENAYISDQQCPYQPVNSISSSEVPSQTELFHTEFLSKFDRLKDKVESDVE